MQPRNIGYRSAPDKRPQARLVPFLIVSLNLKLDSRMAAGRDRTARWQFSRTANTGIGPETVAWGDSFIWPITVEK